MVHSKCGRFFLQYCLGVLLWVGAAAVSAKPGVSEALLFSSDYVSGGYSKSNGHGVVQANIDYEMDSGLYTGLWLSPVNLGDRAFATSTHLETSPYLGAGRSIGRWWLTSTATLYFYDDQIFGETAHYGELSLEMRLQEILSVHVAWKPDYFGRGKPAYDYKISSRYLLTDTFELSYALGYSDVNSTFEYNYVYNVLGATAYYEAAAFSIRYHIANDVDENDLLVNSIFNPHQVDSKWTVSLSYAF